MTREEAISVMAQVCNQWTGKIAEAELVKEAFQILTSEPVPPPDAPTDTAAPTDKPTSPNRAARRAKGPTKKAVRA